MTKKEISAAFDIFIKEHTPDEFKTYYNAVSSFWDRLYQCSNKSLRESSYSISYHKVVRWWWFGKQPLSESTILSSMNTDYVTYGDVNIHACHNECSKASWWNNCFTKSNVIDVMFDLSFKYNIIGVEQKPGDLRIWIKESEDHQTNITGEVIEKIAKCLEF